MGLSNAERQKRWRDRRRAAGLPLRRAPERAAAGGQPQAAESLRDALVHFFAADAMAPRGGSYCHGDETPERLAETAIGELETALHGFVFNYGFNHPSPDPAVEAARLRLMAQLHALTPVPTREEMEWRQGSGRTKSHSEYQRESGGAKIPQEAAG